MLCEAVSPETPGIAADAVRAVDAAVEQYAQPRHYSDTRR